MPRELRETDDEDEPRDDDSERQSLEIKNLTENSTYDAIIRALEANLANEPPTLEEQEEHEVIITRAVENQSVTSEFERSDEQQENEGLIKEPQEIPLEPVIMNEPHDSPEVPDEHIHKKVESKNEPQEMEQPNDKTSSLSHEQNTAENPHIPEGPKTSETFLNETENIRIKSRHRISETIDSLETLHEKLEQHPALKEIEDFDEHYRRATIYFQIKDLHAQYAPESTPYKTLEELSQETGIHTWTLRRWERNDTQPWLLHRITQREQREYGKIEQTWHINSIEDFQSLLNRHPHLEERPTFTEQYHRVHQYYKFQTLRQHGHLNNYPSISALARKLGAPRDSVDLWRQNKSRPQLINVVLRHELTRIKYEANLHLEAFYHRIPPEQAYNAFKHLRHHKHPSINAIATTLEHLHNTNILNSPLLFFELTHYHEYGPQWLKHISTTIEQHQHEIKNHLNQHSKPNETIRLGVTNNQVYLWIRKTDTEDWLDLYRHEHFHFTNLQDKTKLIDTAHKHLALYNDQALSRLIGQITNYSEKVYSLDTISDLRRNKTIMEGEVLHFLLSSIGVNEHQIQPLLHHIGTETIPGSGRILKPNFPPVEPLRTQLFSAMVSDGHLTKDYTLDYVEKREGRIRQVKNILSLLGDIEFQEYVNAEGVTKLRFPAVIGRLLEQWGLPIGDKTIQNPELPDYIKNGPPEIKISYLKEMIPEDGYFSVHKRYNRGIFGVSRTLALDAGDKNEMYQFVPLVSSNEKQFIQDYGTQVTRFGRLQDYELSWSRLKELKRNPEVGQIAARLVYQIDKTPNNLLIGEMKICEDLGINMRPSVIRLFYFPDSGRVSLQRKITTRTNNDAIRWAILAPPNDDYKRKKVKEWLETQNNREASLK